MNDQNSESGDRLKGKHRKFPGGTAVVKEKFVEIRDQGMSYDQIAGQLGVSMQCLQNWSRDLKAFILSVAEGSLPKLGDSSTSLRMTD